MTARKKKAARYGKDNPWNRDEVIDYVLDSYGGVEEAESGRSRRMFLWADDDGEVWIGNTAAFVEHCAELFDFELFPYDYVNVNRILIEVGERVLPKKKRRQGLGNVGQQPQAPDKRKAR